MAPRFPFDSDGRSNVSFDRIPARSRAFSGQSAFPTPMKSNSLRITATAFGFTAICALALAAERVRDDRPVIVESRKPTAAAAAAPKFGPAAALQFAEGYRGEVFKPNTLYCYP